jgi:hypothetical protein
VLLYPDLNGFEKWSLRAKELAHITRFVVSELLEVKATEAERALGLDVADYMIRSKAPGQNVDLAIEYAKQLKDVSDRFSKGDICSTTYLAYSKKLEVQLKAAGIPLSKIVKMTTGVRLGVQ